MQDINDVINECRMFDHDMSLRSDYIYLDHEEFESHVMARLGDMTERETLSIITQCMKRNKYQLLTRVFESIKDLSDDLISSIVISCLGQRDDKALEWVLGHIPNAEVHITKYFVLCNSSDKLERIRSLGLSMETVGTDIFIQLVMCGHPCYAGLKFVLRNGLTPKETIDEGRRMARNTNQMMYQLFLPYCTDNV